MPNFFGPVRSLGDMRSLKAKMADEDMIISQSSKLNYRHQNWEQFASKTPLPYKMEDKRGTFHVSSGYDDKTTH